MRVIARSRVREYGADHPESAESLHRWLRLTRHAEWTSLADVRQTFPSADGVQVASGRTVTVFNIKGNDYRLITAIHYNRRRVYILRFMTHAEYSSGRWKDAL